MRSRTQRMSHGARIWPAAVSSGLLIGVSIFLTGCNRGPALSKVSGTVTLDGRPLPQATVTFAPETGGYTSLAETDDQGHYTLHYSQGGEGAEFGKHRVSIETYAIRTGSDGNVVEVPERLPARYNVDSTLEHEITEPAHTFNFELQSK